MTSRFLFWTFAVLGSLMHIFGLMFAQVPQIPQARHNSDPILVGIFSIALLLLLASYYIGRQATRNVAVGHSIYRSSRSITIALVLVVAQCTVCFLAIITELF
jgi:hypothetical protein